MAAEIPFIVFTVFWALIGIGGPLIIPKGPNRGLMQTMVVLTAVCCYTFWLVVFLSQLNPLFGPQLDSSTIVVIQEEWTKPSS